MEPASKPKEKKGMHRIYFRLLLVLYSVLVISVNVNIRHKF